MSILDAVEKVGSKTAGKAVVKWVDNAVIKGREIVDGLDPEFKKAGGAVLDAVEANKEVFESVGAGAFSATMTRLSLGQIDEAKLTWLRHKATFAERQQALMTAGKAALKRKKADDASWEAFKQAGLDVLEASAKAAIPLLLTIV